MSLHSSNIDLTTASNRTDHGCSTDVTIRFGTGRQVNVLFPSESLNLIISTNLFQEKLRIRLKIVYKIDNNQYQDQEDVSNFPDNFFN